jgi:hypothetical protein
MDARSFEELAIQVTRDGFCVCLSPILTTDGVVWSALATMEMEYVVRTYGPSPKDCMSRLSDALSSDKGEDNGSSD